MPSKRTKATRTLFGGALTPSEHQWLTGIPTAGANRFFRMAKGLRKARRGRELLETRGHMVPDGRREMLERDVATWADCSWE